MKTKANQKEELIKIELINRIVKFITSDRWYSEPFERIKLLDFLDEMLKENNFSLDELIVENKGGK